MEDSKDEGNDLGKDLENVLLLDDGFDFVKHTKFDSPPQRRSAFKPVISRKGDKRSRESTDDSSSTSSTLTRRNVYTKDRIDQVLSNDQGKNCKG